MFRTSPFLEDSDSDGLNDGAEVAAESDPNCPAGKTCRQAKIYAVGDAGTGTSSPQDATGSNPATGAAGEPTTGTSASAEAKVMQVIEETFGPVDQLTPEKIKAGLEKMPSNELRAFLGKLGVPAQALSRADDSTLRQLLKETLDELATAPSGNGTDAPAN